MKRTTKQSTKITKNRITALILALILTATVLSPIIPVKAEGTTTQSADISENNGSGGTSAGAGDNLPIDTGDKPIITTNADGTRTLKFTQRVQLIFKAGGGELDWKHSYEINGKGKFVIVSFMNSAYTGGDDGIEVQSYLLSNETFKCKVDTGNGFNVKSVQSYSSVHYVNLLGAITAAPISSTTLTNFPNMKRIALQDGDTIQKALERLIDSGELDLSKDDYISDEDKADMTPVRDESIGYLPRARYFDNRKSVSSSHNITATIQWDSFQEPYVSDLENPFYVEIYAKCYYEKLGETTTYRMYKYKKYGDVKYISERCSFPDDEPCINFLSSSNIELSDLVYGISFPHLYNYGISEYYVRLVHFDDEKQQLLCGGFTKLTLDGKGGCTSSEGDFDDDGDWNDDPDGSGDKSWDDGGDIKPIVPDPGNPDFTIDDSNVFTLLYSLVKSASNFISGTITLFLNAFKTILSSVGEFPALFKHLFSFLPNEITYLMLAGVASVVVMRFLGR